MRPETVIYSLPRWRVMRWLADTGPAVPNSIRAALIASLYGTLPIFVGGIINTVVVAAAIAIRIPTPPFLAWLALEIAVCVARLIVLVVARRQAIDGRQTPTDLYLLLTLLWSCSVGYGVFISLASGDWVVATLSSISAAAMVGGICFRNFGAPRLVAVMILLSLGPSSLGAVVSGETILLIVFLQIPLYLATMSVAAFRLNKMLIATMQAEQENDYRARHDSLTGLSNRAGFVVEIDQRLQRAAPNTTALFYLDLDGFKIVNDTYGHAGGDRLLVMVADRIRGTLRSGDSAARIGGDEFVVLASFANAEAAQEFGYRLIDAISTSYVIADGVETVIGVSIGIALAPEHGEGPDTLLAAADAALYEAKSDGKCRCRIAVPGVSVSRLRQLHAAMKKANASRVA